MREEWVFILSTCSVIVKLRGLWCDMTGDCFKCPHQWNGWTCLGVTAKKLFTYITCRYLRWLVNSCGSLPRENECVCVSWCKRVYIHICWVYRVYMCKQVCSVERLCGWICMHPQLSCVPMSSRIVCAFHLLPEHTCWLWSAAQRWRGSSISMIGEESSSSKYLAKREQPL